MLGSVTNNRMFTQFGYSWNTNISDLARLIWLFSNLFLGRKEKNPSTFVSIPFFEVITFWWVISTPLKNISQNWIISPIFGVNMKHVLKPPPRLYLRCPGKKPAPCYPSARASHVHVADAPIALLRNTRHVVPLLDEGSVSPTPRSTGEFEGSGGLGASVMAGENPMEPRKKPLFTYIWLIFYQSMNGWSLW